MKESPPPPEESSPSSSESESGTAEDLTLQTTQQTLQTLIDTISAVQTFKGKWSPISTKLQTLVTLLPSIPSHNPLSSDLLQSLLATCHSATSLAHLCTTTTAPPPSKLQTLNHLHFISHSLDSLIHDLDVLQNDAVRSVPTSHTTSKRESLRAETRTLITRIQIGSTQSKNSALDTLLGLLQEDDKNVIIAVAQGIVSVLVRVLDCSSNSEIKEKTVAAIARISSVETSKHVLLAEGLGLLNNLLRVLESGSVFAKEKSCLVLRVIANWKENARAVASRGGVSSLLEICVHGTPNSQALAAGVLRDLAAFEDVRECFVEEDAVRVLLGLCNSGTALARENAISCLCNLVSGGGGDNDLKMFVAREGGVEAVGNFWDSASGAEGLEVAVRMVRTLGTCPNVAEFLVAKGFLNRVVGVLDCGLLGVRIEGARAVYDLAYGSGSRKELGEMGCFSPLVRMLEGKCVQEKEAAVRAISTLMNYAGNRKILRKEEKGIVAIVHLLDPLVQDLDKKYVISTLSSLVHSKKCRKQMVAAGAVAYLQKLVEKDVGGAKKLLDSLGHGKLWGVFGRH